MYGFVVAAADRAQKGGVRKHFGRVSQIGDLLTVD